MTYDEAVNTILEYYMLGDFPGWTMTDPDSAQMRRITKDGKFEFIDFQNLAIFHNVINLDDYSDGELWFYGSMYYDTPDEFEAQGAAIMAECVFEQTPANVSNDAEGDVMAMYKKYLAYVREE